MFCRRLTVIARTSDTQGRTADKNQQRYRNSRVVRALFLGVHVCCARKRNHEQNTQISILITNRCRRQYLFVYRFKIVRIEPFISMWHGYFEIIAIGSPRSENVLRFSFSTTFVYYKSTRVVDENHVTVTVCPAISPYAFHRSNLLFTYITLDSKDLTHLNLSVIWIFHALSYVLGLNYDLSDIRRWFFFIRVSKPLLFTLPFCVTSHR